MMKKFSSAIFLAICLFGIVGVVFANSFGEENVGIQNKELPAEDSCAIINEMEEINQKATEEDNHCVDEIQGEIIE